MSYFYGSWVHSASCDWCKSEFLRPVIESISPDQIPGLNGQILEDSVLFLFSSHAVPTLVVIYMLTAPVGMNRLFLASGATQIHFYQYFTLMSVEEEKNDYAWEMSFMEETIHKLCLEESLCYERQVERTFWVFWVCVCVCKWVK